VSALALALAALLNLAHVVLHGTPLDGGAMDSLVLQLNSWLSSPHPFAGILRRR